MIDEEALKNIESLHRLKTEGVITQEDFDKAKADLLSGTGQRKRVARPRGDTGPIELPEKGDILGWMILPLRRYADFTGRSTRKEYWMFLLLLNIVIAVLALLALTDTDPFGNTGPAGNLLFGLMLLAMLGSAVPLIAVEIRRLHDQDMNGWFALLNLVPFVGPFIIMGMMLIDGTWGENRFGPDPKERSSYAKE